MFKSMLKRSWLSTKRKLSRTVILALILFVMAILMLSTISIKSAVNESISYAKESLGGTVYLQADMDKIREEAMQNMNTSGSITQPVRMAIERPDISIEIAKDLANSQYVKDYTYSINSSANASSFTPVETESTRMREQIQSQIESSDSSSSQSFGGGMPGGGGMMHFSFSGGDTTIQGINSFAFITDVESGTMTLSEGEIFDETTGEGVVISYDLAAENDLNVGDVITLETTDEDDPQEISLTVIGIYDNTNDNFDPNTIYTNIDTAALFLDKETYNDGAYGVQSVKYYLTSAKYKEAFINEANSKYDLESENLAIDIDDSAYQQMVGPIESVGSFATTILWIVIIASVVIITLTVTINIKDRRYEMGVLMSIGATKKNITGQILLELVLVGTVAFVLSVIPSTFIAKAMGNSLLDNQLSMNETAQSQNFGRGNNSGNTGRGNGGPSFNQNGGGNMGNSVPTNIMNGGAMSNAEAIDEIDVSPSPTDYLLLFLAGYGVIIIALIIPTINILRFQPKTILTGKE